MKAAVVIPIVGWGLWLLLQSRRRNTDTAPAPPPAPEQTAPPPQAPGADGMSPAMDEKGNIGGLNWQAYLNRHPEATVDPESGVIVIAGPGGKRSFTNARDAERFEAHQQSNAIQRRGGGHRGDAALEEELF